MRISAIVSPLSFFLFLLGLPPADAQAAPPMVNRNDAFTWDAVTTDTTGAPETAASYDVAIAASGSNLNTAGTAVIVSVTVIAPKVDTVGTTLLAALANGNYVVQARAKDAAGNAGAWSLPFAFAFDGVPPAAPGNLRKK